MSEFKVGDLVKIAPDFSNDGFDPFKATVIETDGIIYTVADEDGEESDWMSGNVWPLWPIPATAPLPQKGEKS